MLAAPKLHHNGTGGPSLKKQFEAAHASLYEAYNKMNDARPHARDYYTQPAGEYERACNEHEARMHQVREIIEDYSRLLQALADQGVRQ